MLFLIILLMFLSSLFSDDYLSNTEKKEDDFEFWTYQEQLNNTSGAKHTTSHVHNYRRNTYDDFCDGCGEDYEDCDCEGCDDDYCLDW